MKLLILGAGGFAKEVEELAKMLGYAEIAFLDDEPKKAKCYPVIGKMSDCAFLRSHYDTAIVALGNNDARSYWHQTIIELEYRIPSLISPLAYVSPEAIISNGCIIRHFCVVGRNAILGQSTILNIGAKVDHDCVVGEYCHLLIGSVVRGEKSLPSFSWLSANEVFQ